MDLVPIIARIVLRYVSGALVAYSFIPADLGADIALDQDLALILGAGISAVTEGAYAWVKSLGGAT